MNICRSSYKLSAPNWIDEGKFVIENFLEDLYKQVRKQVSSEFFLNMDTWYSYEAVEEYLLERFIDE